MRRFWIDGRKQTKTLRLDSFSNTGPYTITSKNTAVTIHNKEPARR